MSELRPTSMPPTTLRPNLGSSTDPASRVKGMPTNYGEWLLPHVVTFQGIVSSVSRVYRYYDEAMKASFENARFMRNDLMIMEPLEQRRRSSALLNWHLETDDPKNKVEKKLADDLTALIKQIPNFLKFRENLLDAIWFGKNANQWSWHWKKVRGVTPAIGAFGNEIIDRWKPLHGDKIVFRYDDGTREYDPNQIGIRVGAGYTAGDKGIQGRLNASGRRKVEATDYGLAYFLEPWERELLAIHKHMVEDGEYEDPQSAGKIHGVGIRSRVYWSWYMKQELHAWMLEYIERSAAGIEIWYYPYGNPEAEAKTRTAAEERIGNARNVILMPRPVDDTGNAYGVEVIQPNMAGADTVERILTEYFGDQIMRYILGQTMTNKPQAGGGFGSQLPQIQLGTFRDIIRYDAINLGETMTIDVVEPLKKRNYPQLIDIPVRFVVDTEAADVAEKLKAWEIAYDKGLKTKASDWYQMIGASKPEPTDDVLQNPVFKQQERLWEKHVEAEQTRQTGAQVQGGLGEPAPTDTIGQAADDQQLGQAMMASPGGMASATPEQYAANAGENPHSGTYGGPGTIDPVALARGAEQEAREHNLPLEIARKIAWDHLRERPDYYQVVEKALADNPPARYLMPDGSRMADEGIHEGQYAKNWTVPDARWREGYQAGQEQPGNNQRMGGPAEAGAEGGNQCPCPAGLDLDTKPPVTARPGQGIPQNDDDAAINAACGERVSPPLQLGETDPALFRAAEKEAAKEKQAKQPEQYAKGRQPAASQRGLFKEEEHPRDEMGMFAEKGEAKGGAGEHSAIAEEGTEDIPAEMGMGPWPATFTKIPHGTQVTWTNSNGDLVLGLVVSDMVGRNDVLVRSTAISENGEPWRNVHGDQHKMPLDELTIEFWPGGLPQAQSYSRLFDRSIIYQNLLIRYYKQSPAADIEAWWQGGEGTITVIQGDRPMRYSRRAGVVSVGNLCLCDSH